MDQYQPEQALDHLERIVRVFHKYLEQTVADRTEGLTRPEVRLLLAAGLTEGRPLKDLADRLGLSRASVSVTVEALVAKGYTLMAYGFIALLVLPLMTIGLVRIIKAGQEWPTGQKGH